MRSQRSFDEALAYLHSRTPAGIGFRLDAMRVLVSALDHPEHAFPVLLVAGTNGKGSVVAYAAEALRASGHRVGRYTSPHLVRIQERITIDGETIDDAAFAEAVHEVRDAGRRLVAQRRIVDHPTFFEALTLAAFLEFRRQRIDVAVIEVGMGARLDATNVTAPLCSAIVSIALDHERFLGDTLAAVAREKAGVLRGERVTVLGPLEREAATEVEKRAHEIGALLLPAADGVEVRDDGHRLDIRTPRHRYVDVRPLPGAFQRTNLIVALRLLESAAETGLTFDPERASSGLRRVAWPGRLEWVSGEPPALLDGAHNPAAAAVLAEEVRSRGPFVLLFGVMRDKNIAEIARALFPLAKHIVLTSPRAERAATPEEILERAGHVAAGAHCEPDSHKAYDLACKLAAPDEFVLVAGSLYLVGEVRFLLNPRTG
ncbi:MAG: bifunctional folylpolyglutamate synthase/dihydrofolate synthase [Vicinamibacteria bacterium]|nr:bifunctional folylpolyglutamate synthase/dihydrofolate synthase [Vicinamibacteria bacterium]